jgi:hypothetical protein
VGSVSSRVLATCLAVITVGGCARASAAPSPTPSGSQWIVQSFHGAGLIVTLDHPVTWRSQLQPLSIHYSATFAFLANFPLQQFCTHPTPSTFSCTWADAATLPPGGMLVEFGTGGYGPGHTSSGALRGDSNNDRRPPSVSAIRQRIGMPWTWGRSRHDVLD